MAGVSDYERFDPSGRNRWGDYSATTTDPADPSIFWTIQEYVSATDQWSTHVTEVITPQPGEVRWKDPIDGDWTSGASWFGGTVPGGADHAIFSRATAPGGSFNVTLSVSASATVNRLSARQGHVNYDLGGNFLFVINPSMTDTSVTIGEFGGTPTFRVRGIGTLMSVNATIAPNFISTGTMVLQDTTAWNNSAGLFIGGSAVAFGGQGSLVLQSGSPQLIVGGTLKVWPGGRVVYNAGSFSAGSIDVAGGQVSVGAGGGKTIRTGGLTITGPGRVDLTDNRMIVADTNASPITSVRGYIQSAYNAGAWTGPGLTTSLGNASTHGLGYGEAGELGITTFAGHDVDPTSVLVRYTRYGDATLDGNVNLDDFNRLAANFGATDSFWHRGDFNYDANVNLADFNLLAANFGLSAGPDGVVDPNDWAALASAVPEPGAGAVGLVGLGGIIRRRRSTKSGQYSFPLPVYRRVKPAEDRCNSGRLPC
jgi:hypothetical protein